MGATAPPSTTRRDAPRGATVLGDPAGVEFAVWAPNASRVAVRLGDGATAVDHPLEPRGEGVHVATVAGARAGDDYRFVLIDAEGDSRALPDPASRWQPHDVHGASRVVDPAAFAWTDAGWRGVEVADLIVYELHVGTFSASGTFDGVIDELARLVELGVTAIELMPVAEFPGARNWGYDGVFPYAPESGYGGPDGLRRLVDAAHARGLGVLLDVVYNHLGPEGNYLGAYGPYFTDAYATPWGPAVNFDQAGSAEVRRFVIDNALHWITEYHLDGLRVDAVHGIFDAGEPHVLAELTTEVRARGAALGREVVLIAESDLNDPKVVRALWDGGWGFDAQWSDDFHHAVHFALTGETAGYYADYAHDGLVAAALTQPFVYAGQHSVARGGPHGQSAAGVPRSRFVVAVQNHDQVGNRAGGERLAALVAPNRQRLAAALLLLAPYLPMLFMGEEYGETKPFPYFVSHGDPALLAAVRAGRRAEFAAFGWGDAVPDPADPVTFERARLDRGRAEQTGAPLARLYRDLIALRRREPALRPGAARVRVDESDPPGVVTLALEPMDGGAALSALFNLGGAARVVRLRARADAGWHELLATSHARYAAPDDARADDDRTIITDHEPGPGRDAAVALLPYSAVLLRSEPPRRSLHTPRAS